MGNSSLPFPIVYVIGPRPWEDASAACLDWGGSLFVPSAMRDLQLFINAIAESRRWHQGQWPDFSKQIWIGARRNNTQAPWTWVGKGISRFANLSGSGLEQYTSVVAVNALQ
jgi:hypothetical protein